MSAAGSSAQQMGGTSLAVRARVLDALSHFVPAGQVAAARAHPVDPDGVMATLVAAGVDEEVALLACCHALSLPPVPEAWLAVPPARWPAELDPSLCLRLGVVPVGPAVAPQERLCLGYARVEAAAAEEPGLPEHRRYLLSRRDQQRFAAAAGLLPRRRPSARFARSSASPQASVSPLDEHTSPGRVVDLSREDATLVDAAPAREPQTASPPPPFLDDGIDASELDDEDAAPGPPTAPLRADDLAASAPGDEDDAPGESTAPLRAHDLDASAPDDDDDAPGPSTVPVAARAEPTTRILAAPALGVAISLADAEASAGDAHGGSAGAPAVPGPVEAARSALAAAAADDDDGDDDDGADHGDAAADADERQRPPGGSGQLLRGARPRELPSLDPTLPASAPRAPGASAPAHRGRPPTASHRFADVPRSLPGTGGVLDPPVAPSAGRAAAPATVTSPVRSRPDRSRPDRSRPDRSQPGLAAARMPPRRRAAQIGAASLTVVTIAALAWWVPASSSPSTSPTSSPTSSSSTSPSTSLSSSASSGGGHAAPPSTSPSTTSDDSGGSSPAGRLGVDLAARQRLHLEKAAQAADDRIVIQELSTAIRIDPRTAAARDALLARARRFAALGDRDRAHEDLRRLQARGDLGPLRADVDALAAALRAAGP